MSNEDRNGNGDGLAITSLEKSERRGLTRKSCSAGRIALGTCSTAELPVLAQESPISRTFGGGGSALQCFGRSDGSIRGTNDSSNPTLITT